MQSWVGFIRQSIKNYSRCYIKSHSVKKGSEHQLLNMTYNSLVSKRFATYQSNIALLDNCTNVSLNTEEIKHHLSTSNSHIHVKTEDMSCFLLIHVWMITYCMIQEIHHQTLSLNQRHQSLFSDHVSCPQRPNHINNQKQN